MCPLFISIARHTVWAFLIIILSLLINELVLAIHYHFFLFVDFLNRRFRGGCIKLVGLSAVCVFIAHQQGMWLLGPDWSLFRISLVSKVVNEARLPPLVFPLLGKALCADYFNYLAKRILYCELHCSLSSYN